MLKALKAYRKRKLYEWHLDKLERLNQLPLSRDYHLLAAAHRANMKSIAGIRPEEGKGEDE